MRSLNLWGKNLKRISFCFFQNTSPYLLINPRIAKENNWQGYQGIEVLSKYKRRMSRDYVENHYFWREIFR